MATSFPVNPVRWTRERSARLLAAAESEGVWLQFWVRTVALLAVTLFFAIIFPWNAAFVHLLVSMALYFLIGLGYYRLVHHGFDPVKLGVAVWTLDVAVLTYMIVAPNPFAEAELPAAMGLREAGFKYLLIPVCLSALTLSPKLAGWIGIAAAAAWAIAVAWVVAQPGTRVATSTEGMTIKERLAIYFDPNFVDLIDQSTHVMVMLVIAGIIAAVVWRSRRLADGYIKAERARSNLARHFSPNVVEELASADEPFGPVRRQDVCVLFADIVGFTSYSEDHPPETVFQLLREFHRRMEQVVFDHGGTVDNYIGDCIMATFGVPSPKPDDAARALSCARTMIGAIDQWNKERLAAGADAIDVRLGVQYGPVVLGAVGSERNLSFAAVGDTCNVASRLQALCRDLDADICIGAAVIEAARNGSDSAAITGLSDCGAIGLRGRDQEVRVWVLPRAG